MSNKKSPEKEEDFQFNLDNLPNIEIDYDHWQSLDFKGKFKYLYTLAFQARGLDDRMRIYNYLLKSFCSVGKVYIKDPEINRWIELIENSYKMYYNSMTLFRLFRYKENHKHQRNNDVAKLMGFANGSMVIERDLEFSYSMINPFMEMSDYSKNLYGIKIDNIIDTRKESKEGESADEKSYTLTIVGELNEVKFCLRLKCVESNTIGKYISSEVDAKLFLPTQNMKATYDEYIDDLMAIVYKEFANSINPYMNYIKFDGMKMDIEPRKDIVEEIMNVDVPRIVKGMRKVFEEETKRGIVLIGEPGVGKTISVHKIINNFRDKLVFWVAADSINSTHGVRTVFKMFSQFKNSIVIFDDMDAAPLSAKDEVTGEFLTQLDSTNSRDLTGVFIATVNDPSKIHNTLIGRPGRFDDVYKAETPSTLKEVLNIINTRFNHYGYSVTSKAKPKRIKADASYVAYFDPKSSEFEALVEDIVLQKFTHVQIASLVDDCHFYSDDNIIDMEKLRDAFANRKKSIENANMMARKGRLISGEGEYSEEAKAMMSRGH